MPASPARAPARPAARLTTSAPAPPPAVEAIDIEVLLRRVFADEIAADARQAGDAGTLAGGSTTAVLLRTAELGTVVSSSRATARGDVPADYDRVLAAVRGLPPVLSSLVRRHAFLGDRPDWHPWSMPRIEPVLRRRKGRPQPQMRNDASGNAIACAVVAVDPAEAIAGDRADYTRWHGALARLVTVLADVTLERFAPYGPLAPAAPWDAYPLTVYAALDRATWRPAVFRAKSPGRRGPGDALIEHLPDDDPHHVEARLVHWRAVLASRGAAALPDENSRSKALADTSSV